MATEGVNSPAYELLTLLAIVRAAHALIECACHSHEEPLRDALMCLDDVDVRLAQLAETLGKV